MKILTNGLIAVAVVGAGLALGACSGGYSHESYHAVYGPTYHDQDRDGIPNRYDHDRDGDGVPNREDRAPNNPYRE